MKRVLAIGAFLAALSGTYSWAADMAVKAPALAAPAPSWTGYYVGLDVGYGRGHESGAFTTNDPTSAFIFVGLGPGMPNPSWQNRGAFGGLEAGYNWQLNKNWVLGVEADINASDINGQANGANTFDHIGATPVTATSTVGEHVLWFGTVRPRLGFLASDSLLIYGTGGLAYGRVAESSYLSINPPVSLDSGVSAVNCFGAPCYFGNSTHTATGWAAGGGAEYAVTSKVSFKAEYMFVNLGSGKTITSLGVPFLGRPVSSYNTSFSQIGFSTARVGLNLKL
jgi:outer membrane immunogenic protein